MDTDDLGRRLDELAARAAATAESIRLEIAYQGPESPNAAELNQLLLLLEEAMAVIRGLQQSPSD
ncbi:hypothetical protein [Nocardia transvalensis]|uniref:hypothetical protein n=1 Tax=Nocardia transvalensis TaxID=37333 RepID=UPI001892F66E|nr:hypothetical protein [Nocardia transvalensis]MBF6332215.1 hypothetical protein [Nocardia transvalensis]